MKRIKWEYLVEYQGVNTTRLNDLGKEGWELVTVVRDDTTIAGKYLYFKRKKLIPK